jgi:hypothetical protein
MFRMITARFNGKCAETGKPLLKGSQIGYDDIARKAYHLDSDKAKNELDPNIPATEGKPGNNHDALLVQAETEAFYDSWYSNTYGNRPD